jgi:Mannosyltransferase (PIG-V)
MSPHNAQLVISDAAEEILHARAPGRAYARERAAVRTAGATSGRASAEHAAAVRDSLRALLGSRTLIWAVVGVTVLVFGFGPLRHAFNPPHTTHGFGWLGDYLAAPAARWDSSWYLVIAHYGYRPDLGHFTAARAAFFPLYPIGIRALSTVGLPAVLGGVLISIAALGAALYGIHRLTAFELTRARGAFAGLSDERAREVARIAVLLTAFGPMAFFLSAVYSEALYLALSIGVFYAARNGRFALACIFAALAGATRSAGLLLLLPVLIFYLYGPREDRPPDFARGGVRGRLAPRYRIRADVLWLALIPAGVLLFVVYFALNGGDPLAPFHAQHDWGRQFAGPLTGLWDAVSSAFQGARQLLSFQQQHAYFPIAKSSLAQMSPTIAASHNLVDFAFLLAAVPALIGVFRRLPFAYFAYVLAALTLALSYPITTEPLMSLPRFLLVLFPLTIAAAGWLAEHPRARTPLLAFSTAFMALSAAQFATWHWVA